eukprot:jgi/Chlat1/6095/Chrsp40S05673
MAARVAGGGGGGLLGRLAGSSSLTKPWHAAGAVRFISSTSPPPLVAYEVAGGEEKAENGKTALLIHGLLGNGRNWRTFARRLASELGSDWRIVMVDLRNHGQTAALPGFDPPHTIASSASDLISLAESPDIASPDVVIGHSLGGKVWVLDSIPNAVQESQDIGDVPRVLRTLQQLPQEIHSRRWLVDQMTAKGFSKMLVDWMASNLMRKHPDAAEPLVWTFNLEGASDMYASYRREDYVKFLEEGVPQDTAVNIVRAERSDRWTPQVLTSLERLSKARPNVALHTLPKAGHWLHVDNPIGLQQLLVPKLKQVTAN